MKLKKDEMIYKRHKSKEHFTDWFFHGKKLNVGHGNYLDTLHSYNQEDPHLTSTTALNTCIIQESLTLI